MVFTLACSSEPKAASLVDPQQSLVVRDRLRNGQCPSCGQQCYRFKGVLRKKKAISCEGLVRNGRCLKCDPFDHPSKGFGVLQQVPEDDNSMTTGTLGTLNDNSMLDTSSQEHQRHLQLSPDDPSVLSVLNQMEKCRRDLNRLKKDHKTRERVADELLTLVCQLGDRLSRLDVGSQQLVGQADNLDLEMCAVKLALNQVEARSESAKEAMDTISKVVIELKGSQREMFEQQQQTNKKQEVQIQGMEKKMEKQEEDIKNLRDEVNSLTCRAVEDVLSCVGSMLNLQDSTARDKSPDAARVGGNYQQQQDHETLRNSEIHFMDGHDESCSLLDEGSIGMNYQFIATKGDGSIASSSRLSSSIYTYGTREFSEGSLGWDPEDSCRINPDHLRRDDSNSAITVNDNSVEVVREGAPAQRRGSNESYHSYSSLEYSIATNGPIVCNADQDSTFIEEENQDMTRNDSGAKDETNDERVDMKAETEARDESELKVETGADLEAQTEIKTEIEAGCDDTTEAETEAETKVESEAGAEAETTTLPIKGLVGDTENGTFVSVASEGDAATDVTGLTGLTGLTRPQDGDFAAGTDLAASEKQDELATDTADDNNAKTMAKNVRFKDQQRMECNLVIAKLSTATGKEEVRRSLEEVGDIARDPDSRKAIGRKINGISLVLQLMNRFKGDPDIVEMGCRALSNLACGNLVNQESIARKNGIVIVLQAMRRFGDNAAIQQRACYALGNLALNNPPNQEQLVEKNGVVIILQAMQKFPHDAQVQHRACFALGKVVRSKSSFQQRVRSYGGPDLIKAALDNHPHNTRVQKLGKSLLTVLKPRERRMSMTTKTMRELYHIRD